MPDQEDTVTTCQDPVVFDEGANRLAILMLAADQRDQAQAELERILNGMDVSYYLKKDLARYMGQEEGIRKGDFTAWI